MLLNADLIPMSSKAGKVGILSVGKKLFSLRFAKPDNPLNILGGNNDASPNPAARQMLLAKIAQTRAIIPSVHSDEPTSRKKTVYNYTIIFGTCPATLRRRAVATIQIPL